MKATIYLYCLIQSKYKSQLNDIQLHFGFLCFIEHGQLMAVCRKVYDDELTHLQLKTDYLTTNKLYRYIQEHESVISQVMAIGTVLPMRLATLYSTKSLLLKFMKMNEWSITEFLQKFEEAQEWAVKGYVNRQEIIHYLQDQKIESKAGQKFSVGARYLKKQQLKVVAEKQLPAWLKNQLNTTLASLEPLAIDIIDRPLQKQTEKNKECIVNWAFLINKDQVNMFKKMIDKVNIDLTLSGLSFSYSGPWGLYSFCQTVKIKNL